MAFASARKVYDFLTKELNIKIDYKDIKKFERKRKLKEVRPPYFAHGLDAIWQLD